MELRHVRARGFQVNDVEIPGLKNETWAPDLVELTVSCYRRLPPEAWMACPLTQTASSDARNAAMVAMSPG
jgi:hypothetical protein